MKNRQKAMLLALLVCTGVQVKSQVLVQAEVRPRTEYSHGVKSLASPGQNASLATSQRTRLNAGYTSNTYNLFVSLQDVRFWGNQPQLVGNENKSVSLHQAWAELYVKPQLSLKLGRMELSYDDQRILGAVGWAQQARSHDLALLKYENGIKAHLGVAYNEDGNLANNFYTTTNAYKAMQFLWLNKEAGNFSTSILLLNNGVPYVLASDAGGNMTAQGIRYSLTSGIYAKITVLEVLNFEGSFYYQSGTSPAGQDLKAHQFMVNAVLKASERIKLTAGFEQLSGTDFNQTSTNNSFTPLYGTNHKFNGLMDYFYVGNHLNTVGLNDLYLKSAFKVNKASIILGVHNFGAAAEIAENTSKNLGVELDLSCTYPVSESVQISGGYSQMFATESMEILKGGDRTENNNWAWLMLTFKPNLYSSAKN